MKRILATILLLLYLAGSSGATIRLHYCMGELASWGFDQGLSGKCSRCGMDKKANGGCCHDEHKTIDIGKDYKASAIQFDFVNKWSAVWQERDLSDDQDLSRTLISDQSSNHSPPPGLSRAPVFVLCCQFLI